MHALFVGHCVSLNGCLFVCLWHVGAAVQALLCRGVCYCFLAKYEPALSDFSRILHVRHRHTGALFNRAIVYTRIGNDAAALRDLGARWWCAVVVPGGGG